MADLNKDFNAYLVTLRAAVADAQKDTTTLLAKNLATVRAAHPAATEVDDLNTLYRIHLP